MSRGMEYLNDTERALLQVTPEHISRVRALKELAGLVTQLGLAPADASDVVAVLRQRIEQLDAGKADDLHMHAEQLYTILSETMPQQAMGALALHHDAVNDEPVAPDALIQESSGPRIDAVIAQTTSDSELSPADDPDDTVAVDHRDQIDSDNQPIGLNKRALRYVENIFGEIADLDLHEADKQMVVEAIISLRHRAKTRRNLTDMRPFLLRMLNGLNDRKIAEELDVTVATVANGFSNLSLKIRQQPTYSTETARRDLEAILNNTVDFIEDANASEQPMKPQDLELRSTVSVGELRGKIRLHLRSIGADQTIELGDGRIAELIYRVFDAEQGNESPQLISYIQYLNSGVKDPGNQDLAETIRKMPIKVGQYIAQQSNVLPLHASSRQHGSESPIVTPAHMPQRPTVLQFRRPAYLLGDFSESVGPTSAVRAVETSDEVVDMAPLLEAALDENAMPPEKWYAQASQQLVETLTEKHDWSKDEAILLWKAVHFDSKKEYKDRSPETKQALQRLAQLVAESGDNILSDYPDVLASLRMLVTVGFGTKDLDDIEKSLQRKNPQLYKHAAQRYVVAAISEVIGAQ